MTADESTRRLWCDGIFLSDRGIGSYFQRLKPRNRLGFPSRDRLLRAAPEGFAANCQRIWSIARRRPTASIFPFSFLSESSMLAEFVRVPAMPKDIAVPVDSPQGDAFKPGVLKRHGGCAESAFGSAASDQPLRSAAPRAVINLVISINRAKTSRFQPRLIAGSGLIAGPTGDFLQYRARDRWSMAKLSSLIGDINFDDTVFLNDKSAHDLLPLSYGEMVTIRPHRGNTQ